jgi:tRNA-modifying protein YgfZ
MHMTLTPATPPPLPVAPVMLIGDDAVSFAQSQLCSDVGQLDDGRWQWSAWLDSRGRVRALLQVLRFSATRLALLPRGADGDALATQFSRYVLRARVQVGVGPSLQLADTGPMPAGTFEDAPDAWRIGMGEYAMQLAPARAEATGMWRLHAIRYGHPWLPDACHDSLLPPALSLNRLGGLSVGKGCYPGQEITARLHYRGRHKRSLCHVTGAQLQPSTALHADTREVGVLLDAAIGKDAVHALAVVQDEAIARARSGDASLNDADGHPVRIIEVFAQ